MGVERRLHRVYIQVSIINQVIPINYRLWTSIDKNTTRVVLPQTQKDQVSLKWGCSRHESTSTLQ